MSLGLWYFVYGILQLTDMKDWGITNTVDGEVRDAGTVIAVLDTLDKIDSTNTSMYWVAPESYLGSRVNTQNIVTLNWLPVSQGLNV